MKEKATAANLSLAAFCNVPIERQQPARERAIRRFPNAYIPRSADHVSCDVSLFGQLDNDAESQKRWRLVVVFCADTRRGCS